MVTYPSPVFGAIADPTRRSILDLLRSGERSAGEIAERYPVSRPAVSRHLRVLREAGLVSERRESRLRLYSIRPEPLREVQHWLDHYRTYWAARLHDLKRTAETEHRGSSSGQGPSESRARAEPPDGAPIQGDRNPATPSTPSDRGPTRS